LNEKMISMITGAFYRRLPADVKHRTAQLQVKKRLPNSTVMIQIFGI